MFPKVFVDYDDYQQATNSDYPFLSRHTKGLYKEGKIWIQYKDPLTLLHEFMHHVTWSVGGLKSASRRLLFDVIDSILDGFYHWLRYKNSRKKQRWSLTWSVILENWNDWLDWVLCR